jgi:hypothetical protein
VTLRSTQEGQHLIEVDGSLRTGTWVLYGSRIVNADGYPPSWSVSHQHATEFIDAFKGIVEEGAQAPNIRGTAKVITEIQVAGDDTRVAFQVQDMTNHPFYNLGELTQVEGDTSASQLEEEDAGDRFDSEAGDETDRGDGSDSDGDTIGDSDTGEDGEDRSTDGRLSPY